MSAATSVAVVALAGLFLMPPAAAFADTSPCSDGSTPTLLSTVTCSSAGSYTLTVPAGTTSVDVDLVGGGGGAGYPARQHIGGNAAEVSGTLTLPAGTAYLYVIVGVGGTGDNHGTSTGGGGSAVFAEDSGHALLAKLAIAGGGGGGAYNGDGGNAGSAGTSDNAQAVSGPGQPGVGSTGGAGGTGNYAPGIAGGSNNPSTLTVATGGGGGAVPGGATGGGGAGGYAGGGGGGGSRGSILSSNVAGGGGGSSLASAYLGSAAIAVLPGTGGVQLPGLVASDGATGSVTLTFDGLAVPGAPTGVSATAGNGQASVSFTAPASDGGSAITSYTVTASPGGATATCPGSPCVVTGLTNGTSYTFTVHATNANGDSPESSASSAVTPATPPGAPTGASATAGDGQASVSFTAPASDGGSAVTSYTVTSSPGGLTATCPGSPCVVTGLTNGTSYTFTVHATNAVGDSAESSASSAVTPVSVPGAPTGVSAQPGDGQASVSFTAPADSGGLPITSYTVTASPGGLTATCPGSPCVVTGLTDGTSYTFTVHATNSEGDSAESSASSAVTPAALPGAPTGASATAGNGQATVSFTAPASDGGSAITSYTVTASPGGKTATCPGSPCTVTGLTGGTSYTFTVHATNAIGDSPESAASSAVIPVGPPAKPSGVDLTPGDSQIGVSFPVPASNGSAITGYEVSTDGGLSWSTLTTTVANGTVTGTVTGLVNGTAYQVQVRAVNVNGPGAGSTSQSVTPATTPDAPSGVTATGGPGQASVSFTAPASTGGSAVTSYTVTSSPDGKTATCPGSPCVVTGLTNGTSYTFTVHATNAVGNSAESSASSAVTPLSVPGVPGELSTTAHDTSIELSFTAPDSGGSPITGYEYSIDGGTTWLPLTTTGSGSGLTGTITGLTPGTEYPVTLRGVNAVGAGTALAATFVTTVPTAPQAPTAEPGRASVLVSWPKSTVASVTGYTVHALPGPATCSTNSIDDTSCVIGAVDGITYTYTVTANSLAGPSAASAPSAQATASAPLVPALAPTSAPTTLTTTDGVLTEVRRGQQITFLGEGFLPYSSVTMIVYSSPVVLGTAVTDASGAFTKEITIPTDLEVGSHNLVASGVDSAGATHLIRMPVTLAASSSGGSGSSGSGSSGSGSAGGTLPFTGVAVARLAVWSGLITGAGLMLIAVGRRRRLTPSE